MLTKRIAIIITTLTLLATTACSSTLPSPTATFTSQPSATPTAVPSATPTLTPSDTPSPTVVPSRTPEPTLTPTPIPQPGDDLLTESFDNNTHSWEAKYGNQASFHVADGSLTGEIDGRSVLYWDIQRGNYKDVDMTVEITRLDSVGSETMYGAICRYVDNDNFYLFEINGGSYAIQHLDNNKWKPIVDWKPSGAIHSGKVANTLRVICSGEMLQFWVNGTKLVTVHYNGIDDGIIGLTAGTFNTNEVKVKFDNLSIKVPPVITLASGGGNGAGGTPKPTSASSGPAATPVPTEAALPDGQGSIQIQNDIDFSVHFVLWGPSAQAFDAPSHQTITLNVPSGEYGWQVFANNCELYPTGNLVVKPKAVILVETYTENSCGYAVRWGTP